MPLLVTTTAIDRQYVVRNSSWITTELRRKIEAVFEPRYKRKLSDVEVAEIAENLAGSMEAICKWRSKYGDRISK